jgi:hypothetical protein
MATDSDARSITEHYTRHGAAPSQVVTWTEGPVDELPAAFSVLVITRSDTSVAYATRCMSEPSDDERLELHLLARPADVPEGELAELLVAVAHYHRTGRRLGLGQTVDFGQPWLAGSACTHGLISLPYLDGPSLEWLAAPLIRFLWLVPVTASEVRFTEAHGVEALALRFDEQRSNLLDPRRASVV